MVISGNSDLTKDFPHGNRGWPVNDNSQSPFGAVLTDDRQSFAERRVNHPRHGNKEMVSEILKRNTAHRWAVLGEIPVIASSILLTEQLVSLLKTPGPDNLNHVIASQVIAKGGKR